MGQSTNQWILGRASGTPADFPGADDIITNLAQEREPGIEIIECTPLSLNITSYHTIFCCYFAKLTLYNAILFVLFSDNWVEHGTSKEMDRKCPRFLLLAEK